MKVMLVNGSPHAKGNTALALDEMRKVFAEEGVETELVHIGNQAIRGCMGCGGCYQKGKCVFDDAVNATAKLFEESDGLVLGTPVYYASANATLVAYLDRLFFSTGFDKTMKVGASVAVNKYFTISGMPVASSQYWNNLHGLMPGEAVQDEEGLQTMRTLARNMTFLMKSIALGKEKYGLPQKEESIVTNFIR